MDWDNAPGCNRLDVANNIRPTLNGALGNNTCLAGIPDNQGMTFMPTVSTLGLKLTDPDNLNFDITGQLPNRSAPNQSLVPFRAIFLPDHDPSNFLNNERHVFISPQLIDWIKQQITRTVPDLSGTLSQRYNFGAFIHTVSPVTVASGGVLVVNAAGKTGFGGTNDPDALNTEFEVFTSASVCNTNQPIVFQNGGKLQLGAADRTGAFHVCNGATVRVETGSQVAIFNDSKIVVRNGGKLILEAGATITNNGRIIIQTGGELIINGQPSITGNGYIRFEKGNQVTLNANWVLRGANTNQRMIQIAQEATMLVASGAGVTATLTLENGMVERERGYNGNGADHIVIRPNALFAATEVNFDDYSSGPARFIVLDGPNTGEFNFERCAFNGGGYNVYLQEPFNTPTAAERAYPWHRNSFRVDLHFKNCVLGGVKAERAYIVELNNCTVNGGVDVSYAYWLDLHNNTTFRSNYSGTAVKVKNVVHTELYDNSLIDKYDTGIDATQSWNHNITIYDHASIQSCNTGIHLMGGLNNAYGLDWGMIYMDCARLLENVVAIKGEDILFNMYARNGRTNIFTRQPVLVGNAPDPDRSLLFNALFRCRKESALWFHGSYWDGLYPSNGVENEFWSFKKKQNVCAPGNESIAWDGVLHIHEPSWWNGAVITDSNDPTIQNCGGVNLLTPNRNNDLMAQNTIVFADGQYRDVKIQQDVALLRLRQQQLNTAEDLFEPIARLSQNVRDTANSVVRHMIDVARVMAVGMDNSPNGLARMDHGWLPEATVSFDKTDLDVSKVKLYPNPANDFFRLELFKLLIIN